MIGQGCLALKLSILGLALPLDVLQAAYHGLQLSLDIFDQGEVATEKQNHHWQNSGHSGIPFLQPYS